MTTGTPRVFNRGTTAFALAALVASFAATTQIAAQTGSTAERNADGVMKVEREWLDALRRHDARTLDRILASEWTDNDWQGRLLTRADYLGYFSRTAAPSALPAQRFAETNVRFFANGALAIVTGLVISDAPISTRGKIASRSRFTDVFVWRDGRWQGVSAQETHVPEGK